MSATPLAAVIVERIDLIDHHEYVKAIASVHVTGVMFINAIQIVSSGGKLYVEMPVINSLDDVIPVLQIVDGGLNRQIRDAVLAAYRSKTSTGMRQRL
jgi:DNA-binding cell septation regulator SpoVG